MIRKAALCVCAALILFGADFRNYAHAAQFADQNIKLPKVTAFTLGNGIKLFYIRGELPQITLVALVGFGKLHEDKNNAGMSQLIAKTLSLSGSKKYPAGTLHDLVDSMGGTLSVESSWEHTAISIKVLERFRNEAFSILSDLIQNPNFDLQYFNTARALLADSIKRKLENPTEIAFGKAREIIFNGDGYGSFPTPEKISSFSIDQVLGTWRRYYSGKNIMIGIYTSGGASESELLARESFSSISAGAEANYTADRDKIAGRLREAAGTVFFYPKEIPQATIVIGTVAPDIGYAGAYSLEVMNYVLGGGSFNSRLMREIRVDRGLAYAVQSVIKCRYKTGLFLAYAQTENKNAVEVLSLLTKNLDRLQRENMRQDEIDWAKTAIRNSYIFQFDTPLNILSNYMEIAYNNLPEDYFITYLDRIQRVRESDILRESNELLHSGTVTVVVGGEAAARDLAKHWKVVRIK
jgi:zinc protease